MTLATASANEAARAFLLDEVVNSYFQKRLVDITGASIGVLKQSWNPFKPTIVNQNDFSVYLEASDPLVLELLSEVDLFDRAFEIAMDSFTAVILDSQVTNEFFTTLVTDLLIEDKPVYKARTQ